MTDSDFIAELSARLRVGPRTRRRIVREISEHLRDRALGHAPDSPTRSLGEPAVLAAELTTVYAAHRRRRLERVATTIGLGALGTGLGCVAILGFDADGDRLTVELPLALILAAALGLAVLSRRAALLGIGVVVGAAGWVGWSAHLVTVQAGVACLTLSLLALAGAAAAPGVLRSLRPSG